MAEPMLTLDAVLDRMLALTVKNIGTELEHVPMPPMAWLGMHSHATQSYAEMPYRSHDMVDNIEGYSLKFLAPLSAALAGRLKKGGIYYSYDLYMPRHVESARGIHQGLAMRLVKFNRPETDEMMLRFDVLWADKSIRVTEQAA